MMRQISLTLFFSSLLIAPSASAQGVRNRTRPEASESIRSRIRSANAGASTRVSDAQASDVTLTLNPVSVRPIQTWIRTAGRIDKAGKVLTAYVYAPDSTMVKTGQRVRAFSPESKSSMFQAWVTKVTPQAEGAAVQVTLSGIAQIRGTNYVLEIVSERGEFLSIPNEA